MAQDDEPMESWKQFRGTELGSMLSKLYHEKPKINYPMLKKPEKIFQPSGKAFMHVTSGEASDPRKAVFNRNVDIEKPISVGKPKKKILHPVDFIPKRRSEDKIKAEIDEIKMRQEYYRPAHTQAISSEKEKDRLNQIFSCKGGKALPESVSMPVTETLLEHEARVMKGRYSMRNGRGKATMSKSNTSLNPEEELAMQITAEIDDRRKYLEEFRRSGLPCEREDVILSEIKTRVLELKRLKF